MAKSDIRRLLSIEGVKFKLFNMAVSDRNDVLTEIFKTKGIIVGSPTLNNVCCLLSNPYLRTSRF